MPTVLLCDDEPGIVRLMSGVLRSKGYTVLSANSGIDAIRKAAQYQGEIDLLLTDLQMPGIGGSEVAERIRVFRPELRVLYMSGDVGGAPWILEKPFTIAALLERVKKVLGSKD